MNSPVRNTKPSRPAPTIEEEKSRYQPQARAIRETYGGAILATCMGKCFGAHVESAAFKLYLDGIVASAGAPTDPVEIMAVEQLAWAHARLGDLHAQAVNAQSVEAAAVYSAAAARLMAEFRKTSLALREYRAPQTPKQLTVVGQQNLAANQQVAFIESGTTGGRPQEKNLRSELSSKAQEVINYEAPTDFLAESKASCSWAEEPFEAASHVTRGTEPTSAGGPGKSALGVLNRAQDGRGEGPLGGQWPLAPEGTCIGPRPAGSVGRRCGADR